MRFVLAILVSGMLALAGTASAALPELIDQIKPSVVVIGTYAKARNPSFVMRGAGFVVGDGSLVATNAHVVPETLDVPAGEILAVLTSPGSANTAQRLAKISVTDKTHDLSLLRIEGSPLPALVLHAGNSPREGLSIAFMGFPIGNALGLSPVTHRGMISAVTPIAMPGANAQQLNAKTVTRLKSGTFDVYQLDGTAYPGNSGGPLFDAESGEVIGIVNMVFVKGSKESVLANPSGISFAIPISHLQALLRSAP